MDAAPLREVERGEYRLDGWDCRHDRPVAIVRPAAGDEARFAAVARRLARLQHPGIVSVFEVGRLPDGEAFAALQRVEGPTLAEALAAARRPAERLALLPRLIPVAHALAHAHARGVAHGELGPAHVVLGAHGETVVVGWDRATDLEGLDGPAARADVRALGALLAAALPADPPRDLAALVARAGAGTAAEVAADLERFVAGELVADHRYSRAELWRRWARRRRGTLGAAALAATVVVAVAWGAFARVVTERDAARAAEEQARRLAGEGADLADFLVGTVHARLARSWPTGVLAELSAAIAGYYAGLADEDAGDAATLDRRALALDRFAEAVGDQGKRVQQQELARSALALVGERVRRFGATPGALVRRAELQLRLGAGELGADGAAPAVAALYAGALADAEAAVAADPWSAEAERALLDAIGHQATLADIVGDSLRARAGYLRLRDEALRRGDDFIEVVASADDRLADNLRSVGAYGEAMAAARAALAIRQRLADANPADAVARATLASADNAVASVALAAGRPDESERAAARAAALLDGIARADPDNADGALNLAASHRRRCAALLDLDRAAEARDACAQAFAVLAPRARASTDLRAQLSYAESALARSALAAGRRAEARDHARAALDIVDGLLAQPARVMVNWQLTAAGLRITLAAAGGPDLDPRPLLEEAVRRSGHDPALRRSAGDLYIRLGDLDRVRGAPARAAESYRLAVLLAGDAPGGRGLGVVARALADLAAVLDPAAAAAPRAEARALAAELAAGGMLYPALARELGP